ncbi:MAG TPA: serine hydrolase [Ramlibacter sp.]|jgi:D-alanyl-D-alanine endopeptidase (penicillin-binding protein 7)|nr:serine hydrolase [Ramlibacter sp.]
MASRKAKDIGLAVLVAAVVAAGGLGTLAYYQRANAPQGTPVAAAPQAQAPAAPAADAEPPAPAAPPGTETVPAEEAETDRGTNAASPGGPTLSFGRAFGLHRTPDPLRLNASAAIVVDHDTGQVLMQKNDNAVLPMASLTKLMTALLVAEAKLPMDEVLTITEEDVDNERHSRSRLRVGTQLTREEALHLALMSSENRAAHALGRTYPGGLQKMVATMNARARQLGMTNTSYADPTGLSNQNRSTAADLAKLVREVAKHSKLNDFSTTSSHLANLGGRNLQYLNSNRLVRNERAGWDIEQQKTGYIIEAGRCLTMLTKVAGHNLIMVLLDSESNGTRIADVQKMRRWVVAQNGWDDDIAVAKAEARPARKAAAAEKKSVVAKKDKDADKAKTSVARAKAKDKPAGKTTVAARKKATPKGEATAEKKDGGRVKQTFAARKDGDKS